MQSFFYILPSLPILPFDILPPITYDEFSDLCTYWLNNQDLTQLELARIDIESISQDLVCEPLIKRWIAFENTLRNELVKVRAKALGVSEEVYLRSQTDFETSAVSFIPSALQDASPLKVEKNLIELRWNFLADQEMGHDFDFDALMIYGLKLQLLERLHRFDEERGQSTLNLIYWQNFDE